VANFSRTVYTNGTYVHDDFFVPSSSYTEAVKKTRFVHVKTGETTPNYVQRARAGDLPMLPYNYIRYTYHGGVGNRKATGIPPNGQIGPIEENSGDWNAVGSGKLNTLASPGDFLSTSAKAGVLDAAVTRTLNNLKDQKINVLQDLAEGKQTVQLLTTTVLRLYNAARLLKRGQLDNAAKALGASRPSRRLRLLAKKQFVSKPKKNYGVYSEAQYFESLNAKRLMQAPIGGVNSGKPLLGLENFAALWLELQYGWRPLVSSAQGAVATFQQQLTEGLTMKLSSSYSNPYTVETNTTSTWGGWQHGHHRNVTTGKYRIKHTLYYKVQDTTSHILAQTGLSNPLNLAEELIPWSFVLDWFVNLGNYLSSLDAAAGLSFEKGCITKTHEAVAVRDTTWSSDYSYIVMSGNVASRLTYFNLTREVLSDFPSPTRPVWKGMPKNWKNYVSAVALLASLWYGNQPYRMR
jgi:hypothetical protein